MKSKIFLKTVVPFLVVVLLIMINAIILQIQAQEFPPPGPPASSGAPIDGGVSILIAAGVAYGAKKLYKKRTSENDL